MNQKVIKNFKASDHPTLGNFLEKNKGKNLNDEIVYDINDPNIPKEIVKNDTRNVNLTTFKSGNKEYFVIKNLTDEDVENELKELESCDQKALDVIYQDYSSALSRLISSVKKLAFEEEVVIEIDRLRRLANFIPKEEKFIRSKNKIWGARERILNKDAEFFLSKDYSLVVKKDHNQVMIETLINCIKDIYDDTSQEERDFFWAQAAVLLNCVIRFKQILIDNKKNIKM
jgi:hypothetical protein